MSEPRLGVSYTGSKTLALVVPLWKYNYLPANSHGAENNICMRPILAGCRMKYCMVNQTSEDFVA